MFIDSFFNRFVLPEDLKQSVSKARWRCYPETKEQLLELCYGPTHPPRYVGPPARAPAGILRKSLLCTFTTGALNLANFEGMCLGPVLPDGRRTLVLIADSQKGSGGLTNEYVKVILLTDGPVRQTM